MPKLIGGEYRICADCAGPMRKLPGLSEIYLCEICSGVRYRLPMEWGVTEEEDENKQDEALYQEEIRGG